MHSSRTKTTATGVLHQRTASVRTEGSCESGFWQNGWKTPPSWTVVLVPRVSSCCLSADEAELHVLGCRLTVGTSWDQCWSMVQYCFMSTESVRLVRTDSPGRPPRLSHSSWTMCLSASESCLLKWPQEKEYTGILNYQFLTELYEEDIIFSCGGWQHFVLVELSVCFDSSSSCDQEGILTLVTPVFSWWHQCNYPWW